MGLIVVGKRERLRLHSSSKLWHSHLGLEVKLPTSNWALHNSTCEKKMAMERPTDLYERRFSAVRGVQAGREYYLANCPFYLLPEIFNDLDFSQMPAAQRAQRIINKTRVKAIRDYLLLNSNSYVFSAVTVSIDGDVRFERDGASNSSGALLVKDKATYIINDGQHRISAIIEALKESREIEYELLPIIFFNDPGLRMSQQLFTDLNRYTLKPAQSLSILYDTRDPLAAAARSIAAEVSFFRDSIEYEKTTISNRSVKLFTLNGIYNATKLLLGKELEDENTGIKQAINFWESLGNHLGEWRAFREGELASSSLRQEYLSGHNIFLNVAASVASAARFSGINMNDVFTTFAKMDWRRSNILWEGRALQNGKITKSNISFVLTANVLKNKLGIELSDKEISAENRCKA
ncbi:DNA sulfur modification protein DndB [Desulfovibrio aminophilus]|uniref:DNA sulfur modification protein DndB n=1 Tax=Desulfovibrio aminophilus TaxID=81425 RepID=UPI0033924236